MYLAAAGISNRATATAEECPAQVRRRCPPFDRALVTSAFELPAYTIVRNYGLVRGIIVRSRSVFGSIGAGFQQLVGGNISLSTELYASAPALTRTR